MGIIESLFTSDISADLTVIFRTILKDISFLNKDVSVFLINKSGF